MLSNESITSFFAIIESFNQRCSLIEDNKGSKLYIELKELYAAIRPFTALHLEKSEEQHEKATLLFVDLNLNIIINTDNASETSFISSTCLLLVLNKILPAKKNCDFIMLLFFLINEACKIIDIKERKQFISKQLEYFNPLDADAVTVHQDSDYCEKSFRMWLNGLINEDFQLSALFPQIYFLHGVVHGVSHHNPSLFSYRLCYHGSVPFVISLFDSIYLCCVTPCNAQFHAFSILLNWLKLCHSLLPEIPAIDTKLYFSSTSRIVENIINILEANWESPIQGVTGFIKEIYKTLIILCNEESKSAHNESFVSYLLEKAMKLSWNTKGKFLVLSTVIPHFDHNIFLRKYPNVPTIIISCLNVNYSASITGEVYKSIVLSMKKNCSSEELTAEWRKCWLEPIVKSFFSQDKLLIQNIKNIVLPWTMKTIPDSYKIFFKAVLENKENKNAFEIVLLRIAKESNVSTLDKKELQLITKNLHHGDICVRMEVFTVLCSSPKKSEKVPLDVLQLVKEFLLYNLNADSAAFHQRLIAQLRTLLIRIRDSSVQEYRLSAKCEKFHFDVSQLEFVDWLVHTAIENTFPGACFQRRRLCLEILNVVYDVYVTTPLGTKKKEKPSEKLTFLVKNTHNNIPVSANMMFYPEESVQFIIKEAQDQQLLLCFKDNSYLKIFPCITDFTDEIRVLTANLLQNHCKIFNAESFLEYALILCNNPDVRHSDSGALLCKIYFRTVSKQNESNFKKCAIVQDVEKEFESGFKFLNKIYHTAIAQLNHAKKNLLISSLSQPLHGSLLALQYCVSNSSNFFQTIHKNDPESTLLFLKNVTQLCDDTVKYMLYAMSGKDQSKASASFAEIGQALRDLAISQHGNSKFSKNEDADFFCDDLASVSAECELLLSCCWHSIKNSCSLLCELSAQVCGLNLDLDVKESILFQISSILSSTLINCRHRGVVDACSLALSKFCLNISIDKNIYEKISMQLLEDVIESFNAAASSSVTRRSAGLPLLFQAVVSSEQNNINRKLLSFSLERLLDVIHLPLPSSISEKTDLPQAHAYHIVRALVTDASLSQNILLWFDSLIPVCVRGFSSKCWAVRNGALQLFGVLLPRLCGQKKVRNDESEHNSTTTSELFLRFPKLRNYLLEELQKSVKSHHQKKINPELVPLLLLVVKLIPQEKDECTEMKAFKPLLEELLSSPVWKIRSLSSSALSELLNVEHAVVLLKSLNTVSYSCNKVHGILLTVLSIFRKTQESLQEIEGLQGILTDVSKFMEQNMKCNIILSLLADIMIISSGFKNTQMSSELHLIKSPSVYEMGHSLIMSKTALLDLHTCNEADIPKILNELPENDQQIQKVCFKFLSSKVMMLKSLQCYSTQILELWKQIFLSLTRYISVDKHPSIIHRCLRFMIDLCSEWKIGSFILDINTISLLDHDLQQFLQMESGLSVASLSFTLWSLCQKALLVFQSESCNIEKWNYLFNNYSRPRNTEIFRMQAAESLAIFGPPLIKHLHEQLEKHSVSAVLNVICLCEGSLFLLQDEDEEIRNIASTFPSNIPNDYEIATLQFNVGIKVVCQLMTNMLKSNSIYILYLWNRLQSTPSTAKILLSYNQKKKTNLFEQEYVNVFAEPLQLVLLYEEQLIKSMTYLSEIDCKMWNSNLEMIATDSLFEIEDAKSTLDYIGKENLTIDFTWQHQVYLSLRKLRSQVNVIQAQEPLPHFTSDLKVLLHRLTKEWNSMQTLLPCPSSIENCDSFI